MANVLEFEVGRSSRDLIHSSLDSMRTANDSLAAFGFQV